MQEQPIIKVPYSQFMRLMSNCCTLNECQKDLTKCECWCTMEEEYNSLSKDLEEGEGC